MGGFVSIFIVLAALVTMVGVMYMVLTEKHTDESKINYVQSPYAATPVRPAPAAPPVSPYPDEQAPAAPEVTTVDVAQAADHLSDSIAATAGHALATPAGEAAEATEAADKAEEKTDSAAAAASTPAEETTDTATDKPEA